MSATLYGSAFASTETDANVCYGINGGLDLYAAIQAPSLFNYDFNTKYSIFATDVSDNESSHLNYTTVILTRKPRRLPWSNRNVTALPASTRRSVTRAATRLKARLIYTWLFDGASAYSRVLMGNNVWKRYPTIIFGTVDQHLVFNQVIRPLQNVIHFAHVFIIYIGDLLIHGI